MSELEAYLTWRYDSLGTHPLAALSTTMALVMREDIEHFGIGTPKILPWCLSMVPKGEST